MAKSSLYRGFNCFRARSFFPQGNHIVESSLPTVLAMDETRSDTRRRQLKAATIAYSDRHLTIGCSLRDISETGARIETTHPTVPDTFVLIVDLDGLEADCEVIWRRQNLVGVRFLGPPRQVAPKRQQVVQPGTIARAPSLRRRPR